MRQRRRRRDNGRRRGDNGTSNRMSKETIGGAYETKEEKRRQ